MENLWLQLGVAGAALFLLYYFIRQLFAYLRDRNKEASRTDKQVDKLCDKIDRFSDSNYSLSQKITEVMICTKNDNDGIQNFLDLHFEMLQDIQSKVTQINERR